jgi:RNA polymerase sigma factor (sigma-70 family)
MEETEFRELQRGNERAWDVAFTRLYPSVWSAARKASAGLTESEAEDVAIEVLELMVGKVRELKSWEDLRALALTIAMRRAISLKRHDTADKRGAGRVQSLEGLREDTEGAWEPEEIEADGFSARELRELRGLLEPGLEALEPLARKLVKGFLMERRSYQELAEEHGIPMGTVGVTLSRSLRKIRAALDSSPKLLKELQVFLR